MAYLVDVFTRSWERARPFTSQEASVVKHIAGEQRAMTMRMLVEGHPDPVSAKRLGVSPRTYAGYVADLKDEFDAETRFQLGYTIGRIEANRSRGGGRGRPDGENDEGSEPEMDRCPQSFARRAWGVAMGPEHWGVELVPASTWGRSAHLRDRRSPSSLSACAGAEMPSSPKLSSRCSGRNGDLPHNVHDVPPPFSSPDRTPRMAR